MLLSGIYLSCLKQPVISPGKERVLPLFSEHQRHAEEALVRSKSVVVIWSKNSIQAFNILIVQFIFLFKVVGLPELVNDTGGIVHGFELALVSGANIWQLSELLNVHLLASTAL